MKIDLIAGARPNFVKIAALIHANREAEGIIKFRLIHTGQHYDENLSQSFFRQLKLPEPDFNLAVGSRSQAEQTAAIMIGYEKILKKDKPDLCIVVGDVTSSMACAITAKKMLIKVAHIEAGIRSNDWNMPEEVNRIIIDSISDYFFTTTPEASNLLIHIGKSEKCIYFVGNTMIDTLLRFRQNFEKPAIWHELDLVKNNYLIITLHRPANVQEVNKLEKFITEIIKYSQDIPLIFPAHPRTVKILDILNIKCHNLHIIEPMSYLEFNYLVENSKGVITDSGGITEETTVLGIPCMTLRDNTERPETVKTGTNKLLGTDPTNIGPALENLMSGNWKVGRIPEKWDGKTGNRIIKILENINPHLKNLE